MKKPSMNIALITLLGASLAACISPTSSPSGSAPTASESSGETARHGLADHSNRVIPKRQPAQLSLGIPIHKVEPPESSIPGYATVVFPVRVTNISSHPIWIYGPLREYPFHSLYIRRPNAKWTDETLSMCGLGAELHEISPGASLSFTDFVSADDIGSQIRVELPIYKTHDPHSSPIIISSGSTQVR